MSLANNTHDLEEILRTVQELPQAGGTPNDAVRYSAQELTPEQQAQARKNLTLPTFERIGGSDEPDDPDEPIEPDEPKPGVEEYNLITLATEVSTFDALKAYDGVAILKNYRHENNTAAANEQYDVLKVPVQPGDVIRDMLATWWKKPSNVTAWFYTFFYDANGTQFHYLRMIYDGREDSNYLDIRENGITIPDGCTYVCINILESYVYGETYKDATNNKTANIITKNADASLTVYDGTAPLPDYVPVAEREASGVAVASETTSASTERYYRAVDDVRIPRYEEALADIETVFAAVVGGV